MTQEETIARELARLHFDRREWCGHAPKVARTTYLVEAYWPQWRGDATQVIAMVEGSRPPKEPSDAERAAFDRLATAAQAGKINGPDLQTIADARWTLLVHPSMLNPTMRDTLVAAAAQFTDYEHQHLAKTPPDMVKAATNADWAARCIAATKTRDPA